MERDGKSALSPLKPCDFNSHAHVERDPFNVALKNSVTHFNSHAHVERDIVRVTSISFDKVFQLTRSRGA